MSREPGRFGGLPVEQGGKRQEADLIDRDSGPSDRRSQVAVGAPRASAVDDHAIEALRRPHVHVAAPYQHKCLTRMNEQREAIEQQTGAVRAEWRQGEELVEACIFSPQQVPDRGMKLPL